MRYKEQFTATHRIPYGVSFLLFQGLFLSVIGVDIYLAIFFK